MKSWNPEVQLNIPPPSGYNQPIKGAGGAVLTSIIATRNVGGGVGVSMAALLQKSSTMATRIQKEMPPFAAESEGAILLLFRILYSSMFGARG